MIKKLSVILGLSVFSMLAVAANTIEEHSVQDALNRADAKTKLGTRVQFYFGEKPANLSGQVVSRAKVRRKTSRGNDEPCHHAMLSALLQLKKEAEKRRSNFVVNIASNYEGHLVYDKTTYQCAVGLWAVEVALQGEIMESTTSITNEAYMDQPQMSEPVIQEEPVLEMEPVIIRPSVMPQPAYTPAVQAPVSRPARPMTPEMQNHLSALKSLYESGELDKASYEQQRQQILNGQ